LPYARLQHLKITGCDHVRVLDVRGCPELLRLSISHNGHMETVFATACVGLVVVEAVGCFDLQDVYLSGSACRVFVGDGGRADLEVHGRHAMCRGRPPPWPERFPEGRWRRG
jgi:hypothetical protein